jgi:hypothetical protein
MGAGPAAGLEYLTAAGTVMLRFRCCFTLNGWRLPKMPAMNTPLPKKKLPIGIQTFAKLREQGCYYVDKTRLALDLIDQGSYYFLRQCK